MDQKTVIALGFFDGVHLGHGALLRKTAARAAELGAVPAAFTFDRSPREFVTGQTVPLLTSVDERAALIRDCYGIERTIVAPFDREMMTMSWRDFLETLLLARHGAVHLVAGHDYRFGHKNEGTPERLLAFCAERGIGCDIIPKVELGGVTVSSTHIRTLVESGDIAGANAFLGHPYLLTGPVVHGRGLGTRELFPTANLLPSPGHIVPAYGVYATRVYLPSGETFPGVTNVGVRPTVSSDGSVTVETHLAGFSGNLYGQSLRLDFLARLREERRFDSTHALHDQIQRDIEDARALV